MGKEMTMKEITDTLLNPQKVKIIDKSILGKCSKCGECCSCFLPVCQEEMDIIQEYVIKNKIKSNKAKLVMENTLQCPYYKDKCMIYEVRPLICKAFYCNKKPDAKTAMEFAKREYIPINMWGIAKEFDKQIDERV